MQSRRFIAQLLGADKTFDLAAWESACCQAARWYSLLNPQHPDPEEFGLLALGFSADPRDFVVVHRYPNLRRIMKRRRRGEDVRERRNFVSE